MSFSELYDTVKAALPTVSVAFGEREIGKQTNQGPGRANRVVFAPGDESGSLGPLEGARSPGPNLRMRGVVGRRLARVLWNWQLAGRMYVWAYDGSAPNDERKQWDAFVALYERVVEACHRYESGGYSLGPPKDTRKTVERRFGFEAVTLVTIGQPVLSTDTQRRDPPIANTGGSVLGATGSEQA